MNTSSKATKIRLFSVGLTSVLALAVRFSEADDRRAREQLVGLHGAEPLPAE